MVCMIQRTMTTYAVCGAFRRVIQIRVVFNLPEGNDDEIRSRLSGGEAEHLAIGIRLQRKTKANTKARYHSNTRTKSVRALSSYSLSVKHQNNLNDCSQTAASL
jgi:serine kinase of HPr protein (carbohydrate metabolism regulator)